MKKIILACQKCGGVLEADASKTILFCPYCGDRTLLVESDAVKIAALEADVERFKIQSDENIALSKDIVKRSFFDYLNEKEETKQKKYELKKISAAQNSDTKWEAIALMVIFFINFLIIVFMMIAI